jgi:hypothetical protein
MTVAEQPPATKEGRYEIKWYIRKPHIQVALSGGNILLDSRLKPIGLVELSKEKITFDQVESVSSVVDAIFHLTNLDKKRCL